MMFRILRGQIPSRAVEKAQTHILGVPPYELDWPINRWSPLVMQLLAYLPAQKGELCEPQLVVHAGNEQEKHPWDPHLDEPPPWAEGKSYAAIVGVAVTAQHIGNGGPRFIRDTGVVFTPTLAVGDAIVFDGETLHCQGTNTSPDRRLAVYFRFLKR